MEQVRFRPHDPNFIVRDLDALSEGAQVIPPITAPFELLGQRLSARDFDRQVAEFQVRVAVLNGFTALGTPITEVAG